LSRRIQERVRALDEAGRLPGQIEGLASEIRASQKQLRDRVAAAIRSGDAWSVMKAEFMRDYSSLSDNLLGFEQRIDEEYARNTREQD
jgi:hypothetical protein